MALKIFVFTLSFYIMFLIAGTAFVVEFADYSANDCLIRNNMAAANSLGAPGNSDPNTSYNSIKKATFLDYVGAVITAIATMFLFQLPGCGFPFVVGTIISLLNILLIGVNILAFIFLVRGSQ